MKQVACPIALHPDGAPARIPLFDHPTAGYQLVDGVLKPDEHPEAAAARALYNVSGLETRATLYIGDNADIQAQAQWHFTLCRIAPPIREKWQHFCKEDGGQLLRFHWHPLDAPLPDDTNEVCHAALAWIRKTL
ncbi:hypothetical protein ABMC88_02615 [Sulfitobacter sp. HNIBRBA2951]|uniref:hypothetical protein n=1 Tax=Sulfitobacter aquimarinus TaxID=3158557 RepID=UPI0032DFCC9B